ncbi:hypothetical protein JRQ81_012281 [Phrynocephalus forsythii]|uniref:Uncharacterized protein n=1 Tax=Phrynocephalus forsythii TaxID=171643 RepID=A0A9Q0X5N7_9SAUR|nr:hypothetical protein JRQ81_012281 [Phrynocephalus forsythii]
MLLSSPVGRNRGAAEAAEMEAPPLAKRTAGAITTGAKSRQATLHGMLPLSGAQSMTPQAKGRAQEVTTRVVAEMVALSGLPLSFVESPGFLHLLKHLVPWYDPLSRGTLSHRVMPSLHQSVREKVRGQLSQASGRMIHFSSNMWTSGHHTYLSLTAHWWQPEDVRGGVAASEAGLQGEASVPPTGYRVVLLQARIMEDSTGRNISEELLSVLREWAPRGN